MLSKEIQRYYQSKSLDDCTLERIIAAAENENKQTKKSKYYRALKYSIAAVLLIAVLPLWNIMSDMSLSYPERVAHDIYKGYTKGAPLEYYTSNYEDLQKYMAEINFPLKPLSPQFHEQYELIGGCYCKVQGNKAAHLKVKDRNTNEVKSLYITPNTTELAQVPDKDYLFDDKYSVRVWHDNDLLYGLAQTL